MIARRDGRQSAMGRRNHLQRFQRDLNGNYIYGGDHYRLSPADSFGGLMRRLWAMGGGALLLSMLCGCIGAAGMQRTFYVLLPYVGELCGAVSLCWAVGSLGGEGPQVRDYVYKRTVLSLPARGLATAVLAGAAMAGEWLFLLLHGAEGRIWGTLGFQAFQGTILALCLLLRRTLGKSIWELEAGKG